MRNTLNHLNVLIKEENPSDIFLLKRMLLDTPLVMCNIYEFDRVDLSLPGSTGLDTLISMREASEKIPIIILTGLNDSDIALQAIKTGAKDYLVKGEFDQNILIRAIQYTLEKGRLEKNLEHQQKIKGRQITIAVLAAQEKERKYIGEELHDNINQILASAKLYISTALCQPEISEKVLVRALDHVSLAMEEIRKLSKELISPGIKTGSLLELIQAMLNDIEFVSTLQFNLDMVLDENLLKEDHKIAAYRIMQEQLNNILKHSQATEVSIHLFIENQKLVIITSDNGRGFDLSVAREGIGITNMINRAAMINGEVYINTFPGRGCSIEIKLPLCETAMKEGTHNYDRATSLVSGN